METIGPLLVWGTEYVKNKQKTNQKKDKLPAESTELKHMIGHKSLRNAVAISLAWLS